jgi:hypothetical protein
MPSIRCRQIEEGDIDAVMAVLVPEFRYSRAFWVTAFKRLATHLPPPGYPKYGYLLQNESQIVGLQLMIFSKVINDEAKVRCNITNLYVHPSYRSCAPMLISPGSKHKDVIYYVVTPSIQAIPLLRALGYQKYCNGRFDCLPALSAALSEATIEEVRPDLQANEGLPQFEVDLLLAHAKLDCIGLVLTFNGRRYPFIFAIRRKFGLLPFAALIYCRDLNDFLRFAGSLGRQLLNRGVPLLVLDANGPISGLVGKYSDRYPKYFKGPEPPRIGDLTYSKRVFIGI